MAEEVDISSKDNPFSFKNFLSQREKGGDGKVKNKQPQDDDTNNVLFPEVTGEERGSSSGNPFSFKAFVQKQQTTSVNKLISKESDSSFSSDEDSDHSQTSLPLLSDPLQTGPVLQTDKNGPNYKKKVKDSKLDPSQKVSPQVSKRDLFQTPSESSSDENHGLDSLQDNVMIQPVSLPVLNPFTERTINTSDEIDDDESTGMLGGDGEGGSIKPFSDVIDILPQNRLEIELKKVKAENEKIKKQLERYDENLKKEKRRSKSLREEIKALKKKEAKETKALEDMIQKVEENLIAATERTSVAETTIVKLRQEIKNLQTELGKSNPQSIHQSYEEIILGVREKANYASQQLSSACTKADLQIKELCQGVESLKVVSEILSNIDSIYEIKH